MIAINTLLIGLVAGLVGLKVALLAAAAVLFVHGITKRARSRKVMPSPVRQPRLDVHA